MIVSGKAEARHAMLAKRLELNTAFIKEASAIICKKFINIIGKSDEYIAIYSPIKNEVDTALLASEYPNYLLPVITDKKNGVMHFANPANDIADIVPSVVAVPLVAFNKNLYRLGYGGGFYDKYLAEHKSKVQLKIGLAFSMQECNDFNTNDFDVKLDYILTEDYDLRS